MNFTSRQWRMYFPIILVCMPIDYHQHIFFSAIRQIRYFKEHDPNWTVLFSAQCIVKFGTITIIIETDGRVFSPSFQERVEKIGTKWKNIDFLQSFSKVFHWFFSSAWENIVWTKYNCCDSLVLIYNVI